MDTRDMHAGLALIGLLMTNKELSAKGIARAAYALADAMESAKTKHMRCCAAYKTGNENLCDCAEWVPE